MIKSFKHKGLERFFKKGVVKGIRSDHKERLFLRLQALHTSMVVNDMDIPGFRFHALKGERKGQYAVNVSGNWRLVFEFIDGDAYVVNYEDYH